MYGIECGKKLQKGACQDKRCLYPQPCPALRVNHKKQLKLLKSIKNIKGIKKVFIASGLRYDLILNDNACGNVYLEELVKDHISGQMKIAPEHTEDRVLSYMGKPGKSVLKDFKDSFYELNKKFDKKQFLTYYLIAAHPGCTELEMKKLKDFASSELRINPEQVQIFTPTPSTYSTLMYYTEVDPFTGRKIFVEKDINKKYKQKEVVTGNFKNIKKYGNKK
jgi:uncharacterized radical SAM protein YgiQ